MPEQAFHARTASLNDLPLLLKLEAEVWPEHARASEQTLKQRIESFAEGFFIAENENGIIGSIITCPYHYESSDLSNYRSWQQVAEHTKTTPGNALYIVSGTSKPVSDADLMFETGLNLVQKLAQKLNKQFITAGALLPGFGRFLKKYPQTSAEEYAFTQRRGKYVDPLIERYRRHGFTIPSKEHVIADYFPDEASLNYSAIVVKAL